MTTKPVRAWTGGYGRLRRHHARRWAGALALCILALPVVPASAARVPVERLRGVGSVVLDLPAGATASLPENAFTTAARDALAASRARTESRMDDIARSATTDTAEQSNLAKCFAAARETAAQEWLERALAGVSLDFSGLVNESALSCLESQFGPAAGTAVDTYKTYAEVVAGQANAVAYEAVSEADQVRGPALPPVPPPPPPSSSRSGAIDGGLVALLVVLVGGGGLLALYFRSRSSS